MVFEVFIHYLFSKNRCLRTITIAPLLSLLSFTLYDSIAFKIMCIIVMPERETDLMTINSRNNKYAH